jgi:m7GpppX diphosphatase
LVQAVIAERYGVAASRLRVYLHYQPSYYHLHVHFTHLQLEAGGSGVERAHLLADVIAHLARDGEYYARRTLPCVLREGDALYHKLQQHSRTQGEHQGEHQGEDRKTTHQEEIQK